MSWVVLAIAVGFFVLARVERMAVAKLKADASEVLARVERMAVAKLKADASEVLTRLDASVQVAERLRDMDNGVKSTRRVVLPAPFPLTAQATTDCQAACALYSWIAIRGEGRA